MEEKYSKDLSHIRTMMEKSTRFLTLSGWSGILAGIYAIIGAILAYKTIYSSQSIIIYDVKNKDFSPAVMQLMLIGVGVLFFAIVTGIITTILKARKEENPVWTPAARKFLINSSIPLITGGVFILILFKYGLIGLVGPAALIFYGFALIIGSFYTFTFVKYLGVAEVILGLISAFFIGWGLYFWAIGFGVFHIVYGLFVNLRNKK